MVKIFSQNEDFPQDKMQGVSTLEIELVERSVTELTDMSMGHGQDKDGKGGMVKFENVEFLLGESYTKNARARVCVCVCVCRIPAVR